MACRQAIIWTNAGILLIGPLGTNFSEILIKIYTFSLKKMHLKMSPAKWRPFCLSLNVSMLIIFIITDIMLIITFLYLMHWRYNFDGLTHWGQYKMANILQTTFSNAFCWLKSLVFWWKFHWSLFLRVQLTISQHWCRQWVGTKKATNHYLNQWWLRLMSTWRILSLNELNWHTSIADINGATTFLCSMWDISSLQNFS